MAEPRYPFLIWMWNSIKVSGISALLSVWLCALAAYAFSRFRFKGRRTGLFALILVQIFPQMLAVVSLYLLLLSVGRVAPALAEHARRFDHGLFGRSNRNQYLADEGLFRYYPRSLEESAMLDGGQRLLPLSGGLSCPWCARFWLSFSFWPLSAPIQNLCWPK